MNNLLLTALVVLVPLSLLALWALLLAYRAAIGLVQAFFRWTPLWIEEFDSISIPEVAMETEQILHTLGYQSIGGLELRLRIMRTVAEEWLYVSPNGETYVEVAVVGGGFPVLVQLMTRFADDAMIETRYPIGENIVTSRFQSRFAARRLVTAHEYHQQQVAEWQIAHGSPYATRTTADIREHGEIHRKFYKRLANRRLILAHLIMCVVSVGFAATSAAAWFSLFSPAQSSRLLALFLVTLILLFFASSRIERMFKHPPGAIDEAGTDRLPDGGRAT